MYYQITTPPVAAAEKQADELGRLLRFGKQLTIQFVTVAGRYKPARARLTLMTVPDRVADQAARAMQVLADREDAVKTSAAVRPRPEWTLHAVLSPTDPMANPPNGATLDGWDSACLTVVYQPGRALARIACCVEDAERLASLSLPGWRLAVRPSPIARIFGGGAWRGVPSFAPVPGAVKVAALARNPQQDTGAPAPIVPQVVDLSGALTTDESGVLLGVAPDGSAVRLARRAMTLALCASPETRQGAVLALMRRGMQAGLGMIVAVDRSLLPSEALAAWEARVRLLDVQDVASSAATPWRQIAPELLAQAIAGPAAGEHIGSPLPDRFATVLDALGAGALRVPAVLGLIAPPGDELRGVLAAGGMVVVPQDGDAASTVIARLLMAYLATPPAIGRATLMLADPALVAPDVLRDQVIQIVAGERADVLLRMTATDAGWRLSGPDGAHIAELLPDLMAQPSAGTGALVETIVQAIGPAPAALAAATSMSDEPPAWWDGGERNDDLDAPDDELAAAAELPADEAPAAAEGAIELPASAANELVAHQDLAPVADELALDVAPAADSALALAEADVDQPTALDLALGGLLNALMAEVGPDAAAIREAITAEDFAAADALAAEWAEIAATDARPWRWRVVLAEDDADRAAAAYHALRAEPDSPHTPQLSAVLDALGLDTSGMQPLDQAPLQVDSAAALDGWPVRLDDELGGEHEIPSADVGGWEVLDEPTAASSADARPDADHVALELISTPAEVAAAPLPVDTAPAAGFPNPIVAYAAAEMPIMVPTTAWTAPAQPAMSGPIAPPAMPATAVMDDAAIRAAWQGGESVPDLIARLVAAGESAATARARVRQAISTRPAAPSVPIMASIMPAILPPPPPPVLHLADMNGILAPSMLPDAGSGDLDNEGIWRRWQAGEKTDDMVYALCGRRGGPKADTARDRIYAVVVPRIVAELGADDLVDRICAGADVTGDPRYAVLMQRLARSEMPPAGSLEQSLRRRLIAARQEV